MIKRAVSLVILLILTNSFCSLANDSFVFPRPVSGEKNHVKICVLPQVELISIVQEISRYRETFGFLMARDSSVYLSDVNSHFEDFREHPAVKMFERFCFQPRMLNFSAPSNLMLMTDGSLNLRKDIVEDEFVLNRIGGNDSLLAFLELLKDFSLESAFNDFFKLHEDYYKSLINTTINNIGPVNYISELEEFYGKKQESYNIVLVSLYGTVGYGNSLLFPDGRRGIYNTMGPRSINNGLAFFGDEKYLTYLIRHEFSHPFVNPLTEKYWSVVRDFTFRYDSIPEIARKQVCGDWQECINEFVVRSVTTYLALGENNVTGKEFYNKEKSRGVICLDQLLNKIEYFQADRKSYLTFDEYYEQILDVFRSRKFGLPHN